MEASTARVLRRIDVGMGAAALLALASLVVERGFAPPAEVRAAARMLEMACVVCFVGLQVAKLAAVESPLAYLRSHRLDFVLFVLLACQAVVHVGLTGSPEARWLRERGVSSPLLRLYVAMLQVYLLVIVVERTHLVNRVLLRLRLRPVQLLVVSFLVLIAIGTVLLALPEASRDGRSIGAIDAFFTATSAVCVTGLVVRDTGTQFTALGVSVLAVLIQAGGLGMLTVTAALALLARAPIGPVESAALEVEGLAPLRRLLRRVLVVAFSCELAGAALLYACFGGVLADPLRRAGWALFHAVSAFCNAGFALFPRNASLTAFSGHAGTLLVVAALIVLGGLGFPVLAELSRRIASRLAGRPLRPLRRSTRLVLGWTLGLIAIGAVLLWVFERERSLAASGAGVVWDALFQSVTLRTAGFNSVDLALFGTPAVVLSIVWMLVGAAPGGTAGGMKVTTIATIARALFARRIASPRLLHAALPVVAGFLAAFVLVTAAVCLLERRFDGALAFESASALGTVGLSIGSTAALSTPTKLVLCLAMFAGRVGPLVLVAALFPRGAALVAGFAEERDAAARGNRGEPERAA